MKKLTLFVNDDCVCVSVTAYTKMYMNYYPLKSAADIIRVDEYYQKQFVNCIEPQY